MTIASKILALCQRDGLTVAKLADIVGVPRPTMHSWLKTETSRPTLAAAMATARHFGVTLDYLADDTIELPPEGPDPKIAGILEIVHELGPDIARRRLLMAGDSRPLPGQSYAEIKAAEEAATAKVPKLKRS